MTAPFDLSTATPAEIDAAWIAEVIEPWNRICAERNDLLATAAKYERAGSRYADLAASKRSQAEKVAERLAPLRVLEAPYLAEWDRRGHWTRAYVVPGGHIHRSTHCATLYPTTIIAWLPEQSGWTEDQIVEAAGVHACTVCYPSAPVEALRAAEAAAKAEAECPGSRSFEYDRATYRQTSYTGTGRATCSHCGAKVGTSKAGRMRAHARAAE